MNPLKQFKIHVDKNSINIPFVIIITGLILVPFLHYSWIASMIACLSLKEDDFK